MRPAFFFTLWFLSSQVLAQTPADWWYFGTQAGMHFTGSGPVSVGDGQLITDEGCTTISDDQGNLLFYSDGSNVWDKNHVIMPNGTGLLGNPSSTHSAMAVPRPGNPNEFYLFTADAQGLSGQGIFYSKVDLTLNGGTGDVVTTEKNIPLLDSAAEKLAGVAVSGSSGYWVLAEKPGTDEVHAWKVTGTGVNTTAVVSNTGFVISPNVFAFSIKPNTQGDLIVSAHFGEDSIHFYDFDAATGIATGAFSIASTLPNNLSYGLEFSPDGNILYVQSESSADVRQFDLTAGNGAAISATELFIGNSGQGGGALQLGPDGKIYCSRKNQTFISVINDPNVLGVGANWQDTALTLVSGTSEWGFPTFIQTFFDVELDVTNFCLGSETEFLASTNTGIDSVRWTFGDPATGVLDTSTLIDPVHIYSDTGTFTVTLIAYSDSLIDTNTRDIYIYPRQSVDLGIDTSICFGSMLELSADQPFSTFLWNSGSTDSAIVVQSDTTVSVTVFGVCDTVSDTLIVSIDSLFSMTLMPDTLLCDVNAYTITPVVNQPVSYLWSTGSTSMTIDPDTSGQYVLAAFNACDTILDTIVIGFLPIPVVTLPPDTVNCTNSLIRLTRPSNDSVNYIWNDGSSGVTYTVDSSQTVVLTASNACGTSTDTMKVIQIGNLIVNLGPDTQLCPGDTILLRATTPGASYVWSTGATSDSIWTNTIDDQYSVTVTNDTCRSSDRINIQFTDLACEQIDCELLPQNVFTPNGDGWNDRFRIRSTCDILSFDLYIYSRWGQLVHYSSNDRYGWDGYINGEEAPEGVYYFVVNYTDLVVVDADRQVVQGSFTLIR